MMDSHEQQILQQRATAMAALQQEQHSDQQLLQYIHFRLGAIESYAIPYSFVDEIVNPNEIAKVPCTPPYIAGVVNLRSEIITVIDLRHFFNLESNKQRRDTLWIVIISGHKLCMGILADEIHGNNFYAKESLVSPLSSGGLKKPNYIKGIIEGNITLLDVNNILLDQDLMVNDRAL